MRTRAGDLKATVLVAIHENVGQIVVQHKLEQFIRGACNSPAIFVVMLHVQAVAFCRISEPAVMI